jgi:TolB-like protein/DNA-binding winged helix-turn-helix (wHTH) protein/Tfp pilus assembly protein PilF
MTLMNEPQPHVIYEFGDFRLDAGRRLLFARGSSAPLALTPKALETILYFVERRGELLEKDRLMGELWPGLVVEENSLTQVISVLRRVLGETRGENRYLATVQGRGYRFVADVVRLSDEAPANRKPPAREPAAHQGRIRRATLIGVVVVGAGVFFVALFTFGWHTRWWRGIEAAATTRAEQTTAAAQLPQHSIAVLPFENLGGESRNELIAVGIAESVLHRLADIRHLTVIAQTSSFAFRGQRADARDIGRKLNARYLVEGSVQRADDRLRITAQLVDATTGAHVWSLKFDRTIDDIFTVEDEISRSVARDLEVSLDESAQPLARFGTDAYLAFLQGRALLATRKMADAEHGVERLSHAIEIAPTFAAAHVALANAYLQVAVLTSDKPEPAAFSHAERLLARALQLDDRLGEAYVLRARIKDMKGDDAGTEADFRKGLALSPNYGVGHEQYAELLGRQGRVEETRAELEEAIRVDPLTPRNYYAKGLTYLFSQEAGVFGQQAEGLFVQTLQVAPDFHPALLRLGEIRWHQGRLAEAVQLAERAIAIDPRARWMRSSLVAFYLGLDDVDAARSVLAEQPEPLQPDQWLTVCLYERELQHGTDLLRAGPVRRDDGEKDVDAFVIRDAALATGRLARARRDLLTLRIDPDLPLEKDPYRVVTLAQVSLALGDRNEAERRAHQVLDDTDVGKLYWWAYPRAVALTLLGQRDAAIDVLEQSFARGWYGKRWWYAFEQEPGFAPLRSDPRFQILVIKARAHASNERRQLEQMRERGEVRRRAAKPISSPGAC